MLRANIMQKLRSKIASGKPIIGGGAGSGISAKSAVAGGIDLLVVYNSGKYRMAGRGSLAGMLAYGDANAIVLEMAGEIIPIAGQTPVLAGVNGTDPFRSIPRFLAQVEAAGYVGVQNFPTVGLIDGRFRQNLEETGMGYDCEVRMIAAAHAKGLLTCAYVFDANQTEDMVQAGADIIVAHMGLTTKGSIGASTSLTLDECVHQTQLIRDAAHAIDPQVPVLCHGGPIAEPEDVDYLFEKTHGIVGFFGASSVERLPAEVAIRRRVEEFNALTIHTEASGTA